MAYDTGFSRRSGSEREIQPVSIISVDPISRTAVAVTRTRHSITINCAYATGDTITVPAAGEQWYCERFDNEWRLYNRIPFNDATLNIKPEEGQVSVGSSRGPLELNGTEVRLNGRVTRINDVYYRDDGNALQRSTDQVNWTAITATDMTSLMPVIAAALTNYQGEDPDLALTALKSWSGDVGLVMNSFSEFWTEMCQNVFVNGLKGMGFGDTDLSKIVSGGQNFIDYLFGVLFCNFDGSVTPETALSQVRDLFEFLGSPNTPVGAFFAGLQELFVLVGGTSQTLLKDALSGVVEFFDILFGILLCDGDAFAKAQMVISATATNLGMPGAFVKLIGQMFAPFNSSTDPIGIFLRGLKQFAEQTGHTTYTLLDGAVTGSVEFVKLVIGVLTCDAGKLTELAGLVGTTVPGMATPLAILSKLGGIFGPLVLNKWVTLFAGFGTGGDLISKLVNGLTRFLDWCFDVLKLIFPFIPWDTIIGGTLPPATGYGPANLLNFNGIGDWIEDNITTPFTTFLQGIIGGDLTVFFTNLKSLFGGIDFFPGTGELFDIPTAATSFVTNLINQATDIVFSGDLIPNLSLDKITDLALGLTGITDADLADVQKFFTNLRKFFGSDLVGGGGINFLSEGFTPVAALNTFITTVLNQATQTLGVGLIPKLDVSKIDNLVKALTGQAITGTLSPELTTVKNFFDGLGGGGGLVSQLVGNITGTGTTLAQLQTFFSGFNPLADGGLLGQVVEAITGDGSIFTTPGPLKTISDLFAGINTSNSLVNQVTATLGSVASSLDIATTVASITGVNLAELINSYTLTFTGPPTGGNFTLTYGGATTGAITYSTTAETTRANIQAALVALTPIGAGNATVTVASAIDRVFTASISNTTGTLALGTSSLTGGTSPTLTVVQKFRGPLAVLADFFADFNVFDGSTASTLVQQVLSAAGSNVKNLVSKITRIAETSFTDATAALTALDKFFDGFDMFSPDALGNNTNTLVNQIVRKILGGDGSLKTLTDLGTFFTQLRTLFGFGGVNGALNFAPAAAASALVGQINGQATKFLATAINDLGVNQITSLVKFVTGSDTNTAASLQTFFAGLGSNGGTANLTSLSSLLSNAITGKTTVGVLGDVGKFLGIGSISGLSNGLAAFDGTIGKTLISQLVGRITGNTTSQYTLDNLGHFFTNFRGMFPNITFGTVGLNPATAANDFINTILSKATSVTTAIPAAVIANFGIDKITNLITHITGTGTAPADVQTFFTQLRNFLNFNPFNVGDLSVAGTPLNTAVSALFGKLNAATTLTTLFDLTKVGSSTTSLVNYITGSATNSPTILQNFFAGLGNSGTLSSTSLLGQIVSNITGGTGVSLLNLKKFADNLKSFLNFNPFDYTNLTDAANLNPAVSAFFTRLNSATSLTTLFDIGKIGSGTTSLTGIITGGTVTLQNFFSGLGNGTAATTTSLASKLSEALTGKASSTTPLEDIAKFLGITSGFGGVAAFTGTNSLVNQIVGKITGTGTTLTQLGEFATNLKTFLGGTNLLADTAAFAAGLPAVLNSFTKTLIGGNTAKLLNSYLIGIVGTPNGGSFRLAYGTQITAPITWTTSPVTTATTLAASIQSALTTLTNIGTGGATATVNTTATAGSIIGIDVRIDNLIAPLTLSSNSLTVASGALPVISVTQQTDPTFIPVLSADKITNLISYITGTGVSPDDIQKFFTNFRKTLGVDTIDLLAPIASFNPAVARKAVHDIIAGINGAQADTVKWATQGVVTAKANIDDLVRQITGGTAAAAYTTLTDIGKVFTNLRNFLGFDPVALVNLTDPANITAAVNGFFTKLNNANNLTTLLNPGKISSSGALTNLTADLAARPLLSSLKTWLTTTGTEDDIQKYFTNLRSTLGVGSIDFLPAVGTFSPDTARKAVHDVVKAINDGLTDNTLKWAKQDVVELRATIDGVVKAVTGSLGPNGVAGTYTSLTEIGKVFTNLRNFLGFDPVVLADLTSAANINTAVNGFFTKLNAATNLTTRLSPGKIGSVDALTDLAADLAARPLLATLRNWLTIDGTGDNIQKVFTNLRGFLGFDPLSYADLTNATNVTAAVNAFFTKLNNATVTTRLNPGKIASSGTAASLSADLTTITTDVLGRATIDGIVKAITGGTATYTTLTDIGTTFTNLRAFLGFNPLGATDVIAAFNTFITKINNTAVTTLLNPGKIGTTVSGVTTTIATEIAERIKTGAIVEAITGSTGAVNLSAITTLFSGISSLSGTNLSAKWLSSLTNTITGGNAIALADFFGGLTGTNGTVSVNSLVHKIVSQITGTTGTAQTLVELKKFSDNLVTFLGFNPFAYANLTTAANLTAAVNAFITRINSATNVTSLFDIAKIGSGATNLTTLITGGSVTLQNFFAGLGGTGTVSANSLLGQIASRITGSTTNLGLDDVQKVFGNLRSFLGFNPLTVDLSIPANLTSVINAFVANVLKIDLTKIPFLGGSGKLSTDVLGDIEDFARQRILNPIVTTFISGLKLKLPDIGLSEDTDLSTLDLGDLSNAVGKLLTGLTDIPAALLTGILPPNLLGVIPVSQISNTSPNLLSQGLFSDATNIAAADGWSWDTNSAQSGLGNGTAKVTVTSAKNRYLYSNQAVPVAAGDRLVLTAKIKTLGLTGSSPVSIALIPFIGSTAQTEVQIGSSVGSVGDTAWTTIGQTTGNYTVTSTAWTSVIVRLRVSSTATAGSVWWDDISLKKVGELDQGNVNLLKDIWNDLIRGLLKVPAAVNLTDTSAQRTQILDRMSEFRSEFNTENTLGGDLRTLLFESPDIVNTGGVPAAAVLATTSGTEDPNILNESEKLDELLARLDATVGTLVDEKSVDTNPGRNIAVNFSVLPNSATLPSTGSQTWSVNYLSGSSGFGVIGGKASWNTPSSNRVAKVIYRGTGTRTLTVSGPSTGTYTLTVGATTTAAISLTAPATGTGSVQTLLNTALTNALGTVGAGTIVSGSSTATAGTSTATYTITLPQSVLGVMKVTPGTGVTAILADPIEKTLTDYQLMKGTLADPPTLSGNTASAFTAMARVSDDGTSYVYAKAYWAGLGNLRGEIGYAINNAETAWQTNIPLTWSTELSFRVGVGDDPRTYQVYSGTKKVTEYTEQLVGGVYLSRMGETNRRFGAIVRQNGGNSSGTISSVSVTDSGASTVSASIARMARYDEQTFFSFPTANTALSNNFFEDEVIKSDILPDKVTGTFTVSKDGAYMVNARIRLSTGADMVGTVNLQVRANDGPQAGIWVTAQKGIPERPFDAGYALGIGAPGAGFALCGNWVQYLTAGSAVRLSTQRTGGSGSILSGGAGGSETYFSIAKL